MRKDLAFCRSPALTTSSENARTCPPPQTPTPHAHAATPHSQSKYPKPSPNTPAPEPKPPPPASTPPQSHAHAATPPQTTPPQIQPAAKHRNHPHANADPHQETHTTRCPHLQQQKQPPAKPHTSPSPTTNPLPPDAPPPTHPATTKPASGPTPSGPKPSLSARCRSTSSSIKMKLRPSLRTMHHPKHLQDVFPHAIHRKKRKRRKNNLPSTEYPPWSATQRKFLQHHNAIKNRPGHAISRCSILLAHILNNVNEISFG